MRKKKRTRDASQRPLQVQNPSKSVEERQLRTLSATQISARITSGPIPDAQEMEDYRQVQADLPERIMRQFERRMELAEAQSQHRMSLESRVVGNNILMERLGWLSATVLGLVVLVGSLFLIQADHPLEGLAGIIASLAALLGLYVWGRRDQVQQITKKRAAELVETGVTPEQLDLLKPND